MTSKTIKAKFTKMSTSSLIRLASKGGMKKTEAIELSNILERRIPRK